MTDSEKLACLTVAFDRLCDLIRRMNYSPNGKRSYELEIEMIRQYAAGKMG